MADDEKDKRDSTDPSGKGEPKDLRYSSLEDRNIRIDRNLDGSGHLTRGDKTKMSSLNFSSKHPARTERDPDFEFRPAPAKPAAPPPEAVAPSAPPVAQAPAAASVPPAEAPSLAARIKKLFGM